MIKLLTLAALAMSPLSPLAAAETRRSEVVQVVSLRNLDLSKAQDVRKLDRRIALAAREVCGIMSDSDPAGKNAIRRCRKDAAQRADAARERAIASRVRSWSGATLATR